MKPESPTIIFSKDFNDLWKRFSITRYYYDKEKQSHNFFGVDLMQRRKQIIEEMELKRYNNKY